MHEPRVSLPIDRDTLDQSNTSRLARWLSGWPAAYKLLGLIVLGTTWVLIRNPYVLAASATVSVSLWLLLGRSTSSMTASVQGRWVGGLWFVLMLLALGALTAWQSGWLEALATLSRLISMVVCAAIVMRTTALTDMMAVVESAFQPFGKLGWVNPARIALSFGMMLRFLPVLKEQWEEIQQAQAARGLQVHLHALLIPMLVRTLRRAEEVAQALDARGMAD